MLDFDSRVNGLRATLSAKLAQVYSSTRSVIFDHFHQFLFLLTWIQDDLHVVDSLELPTGDPAYLEKLVEERGWGPAVLFIDE